MTKALTALLALLALGGCGDRGDADAKHQSSTAMMATPEAQAICAEPDRALRAERMDRYRQANGFDLFLCENKAAAPQRAEVAAAKEAKSTREVALMLTPDAKAICAETDETTRTRQMNLYMQANGMTSFVCKQ